MFYREKSLAESFCCNVTDLSRINLLNKAPPRVFTCEFTQQHTPKKPMSVLPLVELLFSTKFKFSAIVFSTKVSFIDH